MTEKNANSTPPKILTAVEAAISTLEQPSTHSSTAIPEPRSEAATVAPSAVGIRVPAGLPPSDGLDADGLRSYRLALAGEARQHKRYPRQAIDAGWEGTAEIQVTLRAGGVAEGVRLARSSGHAVLDEAALSMLGRALPATPVPPALRERAFAVNLPVVFELPR